MENKKTENTVRRLLNVIKEKWWIILLTTILGLGISYGATYLMEKDYSSYVLIFANSQDSTNSNELSTSDINLTTSLIKDYRVFATSRSLISKVNEKLTADGLPKISANNVTVANQGDSRNFTVTVKNSNPETCYKAAGYIAEELIIQIKQLYNMDNIMVIDEPLMPKEPISPNVSIITLFGAFIGFFIGIALMYLVFLSDRAVKSVEDFESYFDIPVLGIIPQFDKSFVEEKVSSKTRSKLKD